MIKNIWQSNKNQAWSGCLIDMKGKTCRENNESCRNRHKCIKHSNI